MKVILFDGMNLIHRARSGFGKGDHALTFSFFRSFKALVENLKGDSAYFVLEGRPKHRSSTYKNYKSNRPKQSGDFWRQQSDILKIMKNLPIVQIRHPDYECDDVIANLAKYHADYLGNEVIIVSGDSDFIQVFDEVKSNLVKIYHPIKKSFVEPPEFNYLEWKSLRGDASDNIPGIKGVGDKTATKLMKNPILLEELLLNSEKREIFERNKELIRFKWFENLDSKMSQAGAEYSAPEVNIELVKDSFREREFSSMLNEKYWTNFTNAFNSMHCNL